MVPWFLTMLVSLTRCGSTRIHRSQSKYRVIFDLQMRCYTKEDQRNPLCLCQSTGGDRTTMFLGRNQPHKLWMSWNMEHLLEVSLLGSRRNPGGSSALVGMSLPHECFSHPSKLHSHRRFDYLNRCVSTSQYTHHFGCADGMSYNMHTYPS